MNKNTCPFHALSNKNKVRKRHKEALLYLEIALRLTLLHRTQINSLKSYYLTKHLKRKGLCELILYFTSITDHRTKLICDTALTKKYAKSFKDCFPMKQNMMLSRMRVLNHKYFINVCNYFHKSHCTKCSTDNV